MSTSTFDKGPNGRVFEADTAAETVIAIKNRTSNSNTATITGAGAASFSSTLAVTGDTSLTADLYVKGGDIWNDSSNAGLTLHGNINAGSSADDIKIVSTTTRTAGNLLSVYNSDTLKFSINYAGILGAYGATPPTARISLTQTYSGSDTTFSAYTADDESAAYVGQTSSSDGVTFAKVADLNALRTAYENLRAFSEDGFKLLNALADALQYQGLIG